MKGDTSDNIALNYLLRYRAQVTRIPILLVQRNLWHQPSHNYYCTRAMEYKTKVVMQNHYNILPYFQIECCVQFWTLDCRKYVKVLI